MSGPCCGGHGQRNPKEGPHTKYFLGLMGIVVAVVGGVIALNTPPAHSPWLGVALMVIGVFCFLVAVGNHLSISSKDPGEE